MDRDVVSAAQGGDREAFAILARSLRRPAATRSRGGCCATTRLGGGRLVQQALHRRRGESCHPSGTPSRFTASVSRVLVHECLAQGRDVTQAVPSRVPAARPLGRPPFGARRRSRDHRPRPARARLPPPAGGPAGPPRPTSLPRHGAGGDRHESRASRPGPSGRGSTTRTRQCGPPSRPTNGPRRSRHRIGGRRATGRHRVIATVRATVYRSFRASTDDGSCGRWRLPDATSPGFGQPPSQRRSLPGGPTGRREGPRRPHGVVSSYASPMDSASIARTLSRRRRWRGSPLNVAPRNASEISTAGSMPMTRAPERQHVHVVVLDALVRASTCRGRPRRGCRASCWPRSTRPTPDPQMRIPRSAAALLEREPQALGEVRVVVLRVGAVAAEVDQLVVAGRARPRAARAARP